MHNFCKIFGLTVVDLVHHKSFYVILTICVLFVLMLKGCYKQDYTVNGQHINSTAVAWHASIIAFHVISAGALIIAALLSIGTFRRDKNDGSVAYIMSRPVKRFEYIIAKISGLWAVSFFFMFVLHITILIVAYVNTGGFIPGYLTASLVCSLNVLLMVIIVSLLSLFMSDFAAALLSMGIVATGYISDSIFQAANSDLIKSALPNAFSAPAVWRIAWPKISSLQYYAASLIDNSGFHSMGPVHPLVNVTFFIMILGTVLVRQFNHEEF